ncbi:MAG: hypothetical protein Q9208_002844 [Pyrenodesmia sp. 3 TL-2023]
MVYDEAREIAYRNFSATIDISAWRYRHQPGKYDSGLLDRLEGFAFSPLPKTLKNWQIDLHFRSPYSTWREYFRKDGMGYRSPTWNQEKLFNREEVLEAAAGLARIKDLESLKIKFPCVCRRHSYRAYNMWIESVVDMAQKVLEPLKALRLPPVTVIAAQPRFEEADSSDGPWFETQHIGCQQPECVALAAGLQEFLQIPRARKGFSPQELKWLDIKRQLVKSPCRSKTMEHSLLQLWHLVEWNLDVFDTWLEWTTDNARELLRTSFDRRHNNLSRQIEFPENQLLEKGNIKAEDEDPDCW